MLVSGSADKTVCVWDVEYEKLLRKFKGHTAIVHGVNAGKGELVVSVGDDNTARLWDVRTKTELWICKTKYPLTAAAFSANANKLFVGGVDN
jgi:Prp8 binding protein